MRPLPDTSALARVVFYVTLACFLALEWRMRLRSALNRAGSRADRGSRPVLAVTIAGGVTGGFVVASHVPSAAIEAARWPVFLAGMVLFVAGIVVRQWAIATLGRFFTTDVRLQSGQTVVEGGPYRFVRHPSYSGLLLSFVGIGLALGNWAAILIFAVVPTVGLVFRIRVEERALLAGLGDPYRRFAASRARLVPWVW